VTVIAGRPEGGGYGPDVSTRTPAVVERPRSELARVAAGLARWRWPLLVGVALLVSLRAIGHGHGDWDLFVRASRHLLGEGDAPGRPGGLHLYASEPDVVTGPLTLLVVRATAGFGRSGSYAVGVVLANLMAVAALAGAERSAAALGRMRPETTLMGGVVVLVAWSELAGFGHLDDALTLLAVTIALVGIATGRGLTVGLALGVAIASKQWGVMFVPLAFALPGRERGRALVVGVGLGLLAWLPFVVAAPKMLAQRGLYQIVADDSLFGVLDYPRLQGPTWVRGAQLAAGLAVVAVAVWRGRWPAAILTAMALRVLLDPATWSYYTAPVVLGACVWDLLGTRRRLPWWTVAEFLLLAEVSLAVDDPRLRGSLRALACVVALVPLLGARRARVPAAPDGADPARSPAG
jgi:hypothetical protein